MTTEPLLEVRGVAKAFPGVQALDGVSLSVWPGSVHALVGENGAGKSTLMRILAGVYPPDAGELRWDGAPFTLANPAASRALGISTIFQEFTLFPDLSVAENVHVNHEPRARSGRVDWKAMFAATERLLGPLAGGIDVRREVRLLSVAQQQLVEIVKALSVDARLIIMDEPTAALNPTEVSHLFEVITQLKQHGCAVIFISHRLDEVFSIGDVITVLKDGQLVTTQPRDRLTKDEVVRLMVGRSLVETFPAKGTCTEMRPLLRVDKLTTAHVRDVTFTLNAGELLGIAGLEGHGQVQLARALFGLESARSGRIILGGTPVDLRHPAEAIGRGIAFVSDDRKGEGLALMLSVGENVALPNLRRFSQLGVMSAVPAPRTCSTESRRRRRERPFHENSGRWPGANTTS